MNSNLFFRNAFSTYIHAYRDDIIAQFGLKVWKQRLAGRVENFQTLQDIAAPTWNKLSNEQKEKYKNRAKTEPSHPTKNRTTYNTLGQDIAEIAIKKEQDKEKCNLMASEITSLVSDTAGKQ